MTIINSDAARAEYAKLQEDRADWFAAHNITLFTTKETRTDALDNAARCKETGLIDTDYRDFLKGRASQILARRRAEAEAKSRQVTADFKRTFKRKKRGAAA